MWQASSPSSAVYSLYAGSTPPALFRRSLRLLSKFWRSFQWFLQVLIYIFHLHSIYRKISLSFFRHRIWQLRIVSVSFPSEKFSGYFYRIPYNPVPPPQSGVLFAVLSVSPSLCLNLQLCVLIFSQSCRFLPTASPFETVPGFW